MVNLLPIVIALLLVAGLLRIGFVFHAAYVVLGVYVVSLLWSRYAIRSVSVRREYDRRALNGDTATVRLIVENRGLWPIPWIKLHDRLPVALAAPPFYATLISLLPRERCVLTYQLRCRQRGYYTLGPLRLSGSDVLGLHPREVEFATPDHITVYPRILPLDELVLPSKSPFGYLKTFQPLYEDPARVVGVRDYQSGDSIRKVNWKTTAASGKLQVRKLEPAMTLQTALLLNLNTSEYDERHAHGATELAIVVTASLANYLAGLRQEIGLMTNGIDPITEGGIAGVSIRKGRAHLVSVLEMLGRIEATSGSDFCSFVRGQQASLPWGATVVVVTGRATDGFWETLLTLKRNGLNVAVIFCDYPSQYGFDQAAMRGKSLGFECHRVWREEDVDAWRRRVAVWR